MTKKCNKLAKKFLESDKPTMLSQEKEKLLIEVLKNFNNRLNGTGDAAFQGLACGAIQGAVGGFS